MSKSSTVVYDDTGVGNIDLSKYRDKSVLVSKPIQADTVLKSAPAGAEGTFDTTTPVKNGVGVVYNTGSITTIPVKYTSV